MLEKNGCHLGDFGPSVKQRGKVRAKTHSLKYAKAPESYHESFNTAAT